ncbi:DUF885 family protein [Rhodanobacter sp. 115]|uniref:DUF885 domain-containing protein n=1 Tax=Rhodanobacter sp. FW021-MT20 TaxID=1162282 RepID=UPI000310462A|nr:DUF885 family protein [Rhodanobacter sp. 115]
MTATPAPTNAPPNEAGARLRALYEREWAWRREQFAGFDDEDGEGAPADHLPRVDAATQSQREHYWRDVLAQLDALPLDQLGERDATDFAAYRAQIETLLSQQQFRCWEMPFNSDSAFWTDLGFTARRARHDADDYERYLGQLHDIPRYFNEHIANMRAGLARGFSVPRVTLTGREQSIAQVLDTACIKDNLFYTPFRTMPANIPADTQAHLRERAATAIRTVVLPAHAKLLDFIRDEYLPQARATLSAEAMPDGAAFYRAQIRRFTTLDMAPEAIHTLGLQEVARLREEMLATITPHWFQRRLRVVPALPAYRSAVLPADRRAIAAAGGMDRQSRGRLHRTATWAGCHAGVSRSSRCRRNWHRSTPAVAAVRACISSTPTTCLRDRCTR